MTISTLKRKLDDQDDVDLFHSKSKRCKFNIQKELISEIIITTNTLDIMIKKPLISQQESIENISCEYESMVINHSSKPKDYISKSKVNEFTPKPKSLCEKKVMNKPTTCMKCKKKFFACSFNLSQGEDLQECYRQTVRSYLLERSLGLIRNPDNV